MKFKCIFKSFRQDAAHMGLLYNNTNPKRIHFLVFLILNQGKPNLIFCLHLPFPTNNIMTTIFHGTQEPANLFLGAGPH